MKGFTLVLNSSLSLKPLSLIGLLLRAELCETRDEAKEAIEENRVSINDEIVDNIVFHATFQLENIIVKVVNTNGESNTIKVKVIPPSL